jgi:simple sugar transport system permease protein
LLLTALVLKRTRFGLRIRAVGENPAAVDTAGISVTLLRYEAVIICGMLCGVAGGYLAIAQSAGFVGIAVALMGRSHPAGIILAAILFGVLYQGGAELSFEMPNISRDMIVIIQGLVILFAGALEHMFRPAVQTLFASFSPRTVGLPVTGGKGA